MGFKLSIELLQFGFSLVVLLHFCCTLCERLAFERNQDKLCLPCVQFSRLESIHIICLDLRRIAVDSSARLTTSYFVPVVVFTQPRSQGPLSFSRESERGPWERGWFSRRSFIYRPEQLPSFPLNCLLPPALPDICPCTLQGVQFFFKKKSYFRMIIKVCISDSQFSEEFSHMQPTFTSPRE